MKFAHNNKPKLQQQIKRLLIFFIFALVISGLTAFPIEGQLGLAKELVNQLNWNTAFTRWIGLAYEGVRDTNLKYPFMAYGTDWLAFAHLVIAIVFIGPLRDPVRNICVVEFGIIACLAVLPLAFIAGAARGIPLYWRLIDCIFGIFGGWVMWRCHTHIKALEKLTLKK